jgi:hypothetical protein
VLIDLRQLHQLFEEADAEEEFEHVEERQKHQKYYAYPQAGLVTAGHVQANGLISKFRTRVKKLNDRIRTEREVELGEDLDEVELPAVEGIAFQGYNAVMHCTRGLGSQHHDAQKGYVTGAISASWVQGEGKAKTTGRDLVSQCTHQLPHERYDRKISNDEIERDL